MLVLLPLLLQQSAEKSEGRSRWLLLLVVFAACAAAYCLWYCFVAVVAVGCCESVSASRYHYTLTLDTKMYGKESTSAASSAAGEPKPALPLSLLSILSCSKR